MYNVKKPVQLTIHTTDVEMHEAFKAAMKDRQPSQIAGKEMMVCSTQRDSSSVTARLQEFTRVQIPWTGEGLPPVGTVCEFKSKELHDWFVCEVMYLSRWTIVVDMKNDDGEPSNAEGAYDPETVEFRPIRTPEQIEAEERRIGVNEMTAVFDSNFEGARRDGLEALWDAGYRKQPTAQ